MCLGGRSQWDEGRGEGQVAGRPVGCCWDWVPLSGRPSPLSSQDLEQTRDRTQTLLCQDHSACHAERDGGTGRKADDSHGPIGVIKVTAVGGSTLDKSDHRDERGQTRSVLDGEPVGFPAV